MSTRKTEITKEECAKFYKDYYTKLYSLYPMASFELKSNDTILHFFHGLNDPEDGNTLIYFWRDEEYGELFEKCKALQIAGEEKDIGNLWNEYKSMGHIIISMDRKIFDFMFDWDFQFKGHGTTIYNNYLDILNMLGIEDADQYELRINNNPNHDFFKRMQSKKLIARVAEEANFQKALNVLEDFANHPYKLRIHELNAIIKYALNSGIHVSTIASAINRNGFNISYNTVNGIFFLKKEDMDEFKAFNISGLSPLSCIRHFTDEHNFAFMEMLGDVNKDETLLAFEKIKEYAFARYEKRKVDNLYPLVHFDKYGILGHFILDWDRFGLFVKYLTEDIKNQVKELAINMFEDFDPNHYYRMPFDLDSESTHVIRVLKDADFLNKDTYIRLYQKAMNRNYTFDDFNGILSYYIDHEEHSKAYKEISENIFCPSPKNGWQKVPIYGYRIPKLAIPENLSKKPNIRQLIKTEVINQGIAKETKIMTDMIGKTTDGKVIQVDNVKDWLFGVPGIHGNMQMMGTTGIAFPPQTPNIVLEIVQKALDNLS